MGMMAWNSLSRLVLTAPMAESPSTIYSSRRAGSLVRQSTNFCTRLARSIWVDRVFLMLWRVFSACSQIGRASCREREEVAVCAGAGNDEESRRMNRRDETNDVK